MPAGIAGGSTLRLWVMQPIVRGAANGRYRVGTLNLALKSLRVTIRQWESPHGSSCWIATQS